MWQLFLGSLLLGLIHPLFPNHWLPLIAISKTEKWTNKETIFATLITGFSHTLSTIIIGVIVGFVGIKLSENYSHIIRIAAPLMLIRWRKIISGGSHRKPLTLLQRAVNLEL